jgi:hypothetical protein
MNPKKTLIFDNRENGQKIGLGIDMHRLAERKKID